MKTKFKKVETYNNGDEIQYVYEDSHTDGIWENLTIGAQTEYNGSSDNIEALSGKLYTWYVVDDERGIIQKGGMFHLMKKIGMN